MVGFIFLCRNDLSENVTESDLKLESTYGHQSIVE